MAYKTVWVKAVCGTGLWGRRVGWGGGDVCRGKGPQETQKPRKSRAWAGEGWVHGALGRFTLCLSAGPLVDLSALPPKPACSISHLCPAICDSMDCSPPSPLSMEFSMPECWRGLPFPSWGDLPDLEGLNPGLLHWQADSLPLNHLGSWSRWAALSCHPESPIHLALPLHSTYPTVTSRAEQQSLEEQCPREETWLRGGVAATGP